MACHYCGKETGNTRDPDDELLFCSDDCAEELELERTEYLIDESVE